MEAPDPKALRCELLGLRCKRADRAAWEELVAEFERPLFYYLRRMLRGEDEAWVVLQETWVRVFSSLATLEDPGRIAPWLYAVARNALSAHVALDARERSHGEELDEALHAQVKDEPHDPEQVHAALAALPIAQREVLVLHFLDDLPLQAIADVLDIPVGTVKSRLHYARRALAIVISRKEARHES